MGNALFADNSFFDSYVYQSWASFDTLNGTTTTDVVQTTDGYINIGTYEGLARFDCVNFTTHKKSKDNGLTFVSVRAILEDSTGALWIGAGGDGKRQRQAGGRDRDVYGGRAEADPEALQRHSGGLPEGQDSDRPV